MPWKRRRGPVGRVPRAASARTREEFLAAQERETWSVALLVADVARRRADQAVGLDASPGTRRS
jgi:hypothetical protein